MASGLIRGFHLLLAGLLAGSGVGILITCGVLFEQFLDDRSTALRLTHRVLHFYDPLRTAAVLALAASSLAMMLRSRKLAGRVRFAGVLALVFLQGWHVFGIRPGLNQSTPIATVVAQPAVELAPAAQVNADLLRRYRQAFGVMLGQCLIAAMLLAGEALARPLSAGEIADGWRESLRRGEGTGDGR